MDFAKAKFSFRSKIGCRSVIVLIIVLSVLLGFSVSWYFFSGDFFVGSVIFLILSAAIYFIFDQTVKKLEGAEDKVREKTVELDIKIVEAEGKNKILEDTKGALLNVLEDVEKEKEKSEALAADLRKFRLAVDNASDHIIITDANARILYANNAAEITTGYPVGEMLGNTPSLWGSLMPREFYKKMWEMIRDEKQPFIGEVNNRRKNGESYVAEIKISPILDDEGNIKFYVGLERDITKAKDVDRAKTEFVSLSSHQLRTPLSIINWYTEMLIDGGVGKLSVGQKDYIEEIHRTNHRMIDLVDAFLNVSRIDMGTLPANPQKINLGEISDDIIGELSPQIKLKKLSVEKDYSSSLYIEADLNLTRIILQNIISNAVKYNREGKKLSISFQKQGKEVLIKVSDSGIGIPASQQPKIFDKLFRADNARKADPDGNGLGLYLAKAAVERSGGRIWFESVEGKGTDFFVILPVSADERSNG